MNLTMDPGVRHTKEHKGVSMSLLVSGRAFNKQGSGREDSCWWVRLCDKRKGREDEALKSSLQGWEGTVYANTPPFLLLKIVYQRKSYPSSKALAYKLPVPSVVRYIFANLFKHPIKTEAPLGTSPWTPHIVSPVLWK